MTRSGLAIKMLFIAVVLLLFSKNAYGQFSDPGNLRLVNGSSTGATAGRLEIILEQQWGTICSVGFGQDDAQLACMQLGYRTVVSYGTVEELGFPQASSSTRIWISNLSCDLARDLTVYHCPRSSGFSCTHSQDVALECSSPYATDPSEVQLVSKNEQTSPYLTAGRLDIFYVGRWGTTCSEGLTSSDAAALCSILTGSTSVLSYGAVGSQSILSFDQGSSSTPIWVQDFSCYYSNEDRRYYCNSDGIGITDCTHSQDLAISCLADGAVRLVSRSNSFSHIDPGTSAGRLEIYYSGEWGTVCNSQFDQTDANVVCQQLGYGTARRYGNVASLGYDEGSDTIWLSNIQCGSNDIFLANCNHSGFGNAVCRHSQDMAIICNQSSNTVSINIGSVVGAIVAASIFGFIVAIIACCILCCCGNKE